MNNLIQLHFSNRNEWHQWLLKNHSASKGIWLVYYKKSTNIKSISYEESIEEALCFGWIDSIIKSIDKERYARKFTPRTNTKLWSDLNIKRVQKLIKEGRMQEAGLSKIGFKVNNKYTGIKEKESFEVPDFITDFFKENPPALENFNSMAPTYKKQYVLWITNAKQNTTIRKRLFESVCLLKVNKRLGLK
jgi:uncharacterized protein YdeI (YjbR/CyaY-like superfamily)